MMAHISDTNWYQHWHVHKPIYFCYSYHTVKRTHTKEKDLNMLKERHFLCRTLGWTTWKDPTAYFMRKSNMKLFNFVDSVIYRVCRPASCYPLNKRRSRRMKSNQCFSASPFEAVLVPCICLALEQQRKEFRLLKPQAKMREKNI